jgi:hypothetical protein
MNHAGEKFGRWTVLSRAQKSKAGQTRWLCRCSCGNECVVQGAALRNGQSRSCGCLKVETTISRSTKHGHAPASGMSPTYNSWAAMIARCDNPKHAAFPYYGGQGISVCERWYQFENFLADMGEKPNGTSIDRKRTNGNYELGNCRWATSDEQMTNTSRNTFITSNGRTHTISEWSKLLGIHQSTISWRLSRGATGDQALAPARKRLCDR